MPAPPCLPQRQISCRIIKVAKHVRVTQPATRNYLIAYDVRDKRRLAKMGRACGKAALRLQDSLYSADLTIAGLAKLTAQLTALIDTDIDDLRIYTVPEAPYGAWFGPDPETSNSDVFLFNSASESIVFALRRQNMNMKRS